MVARTRSLAPNLHRILPRRFALKDCVIAFLHWSSGSTYSTTTESDPSVTREVAQPLVPLLDRCAGRATHPSGEPASVEAQARRQPSHPWDTPATHTKQAAVFATLLLSPRRIGVSRNRSSAAPWGADSSAIADNSALQYSSKCIYINVLCVVSFLQ